MQGGCGSIIRKMIMEKLAEHQFQEWDMDGQTNSQMDIYIFSKNSKIKLSPSTDTLQAKKSKKREYSRGMKVLRKKQILRNQKRKRRGRRGLGNKTENNLIIFSANSAGLSSKLTSFKNQIDVLNAKIFTLQESHFPSKGKLQLQDFDIFEAI
jgi:hypothetical protein